MQLLKLLLPVLLAGHLFVPEARAEEFSCSGSAGGKPTCPVGNPLDVTNGNKFQRDVDLPALPGVMGLEIVRYYNSNLSGIGKRTGILGRGWRLSYEMSAAAIGDTVQIIEADGHRSIFSRDPLHPSVCSSADPANGQVDVRRTPDGDEYIWRKTDGQRLSFNTQGRLVQILAPTGEFVSMQHDARGWLVKVTDPQGRSLNLNYLDKRDAAKGDRFQGVQRIDTPVGRFTYGYGSELPKGSNAERRQLLANLVQVGMPDGSVRQYHYEDARFPTLLTGISVQGADQQGKPVMQRFATFGYDANAKAVLSTHANNVDRITLDTSIGGQTILTNSLGQKTVYRYGLVAGALRVQEVRGAGCELCDEPNVRYGYDTLGRMTSITHLDEAGVPVNAQTVKFDYYGRPVEMRRVDYHGGKPAQSRLLMRVEYAAGTGLRPSLIARPSVVPGKELVTRIEYNAAGQPVSVSQTGWSPAFEGKEAAVRIARTVHYRYVTVNDRNVLAEIDGPLSNGKTNSPADSDVTVFKYDHRQAPSAAAATKAFTQYDRQDGLLTRVIAPGNLVTEVLERDLALRPTRLRTTDGDLVQEFSVTSNWRGAPLRFELAAGALRRKMDYEYNRFGQLAAVTMPGNLRTTFVLDSAGRLLPDGSGIRGEQALQVPAFSREVSTLIEAARLEPAFAEVIAPAADTGKRPDAAERIRMRTGVPGSMSEHIVEELFRIADGEVKTEVLARRWLDDFGRLVAVQYPGQRVTRATYHGGSERVATLTDAAGIVTHLDYNTRGQLTTLERTGRDGNLAERIQYKHQGKWLVEMAKYAGTNTNEPESRIGFVHNAFGQITKECQASRTASYCVNHTYDDAGRLIKTWLTEHSGTDQSHDLPVVSMRYASGAELGGQIDSIRVGDAWFGQRIVVSALRWLLPSPPLATAWRFGNGLNAQGQYEALKGQQTSFAWRLRGFHDGIHAYTISSDDSGHIDAVRQHERGTLAENDSWHLMPEAHAAPASPEAISSNGTIAFGTADTDANKFDAAGRLLSYRSGQGELDLMWDSAGQLVQVHRQGKRVAIYGYDAQGRRISKTVDAEGSANRVFIYSGQQLIAEADANGSILKQFIYLGWRPVAWIEPARTLMQRVKQYLFGPKIVYLHTDHRGAVTAATDGDQRILWESNVDAFGNVHSAGNERLAIEQPLRLAGQYADRETGLHYNLARYYDPRNGNFISPDPAGLESGSLDLYAYADGDPLNYFDPDGWAKVAYYAITSKADGKTALGTNQGFTKARWAFVISDIKDGVKENVIYDPTGGFVKSSFKTAKGDAFAWNKSDAGDPTSLLRKYYGDSLISLSEFVIDNFDDAKARAILEKLGYAGEKPSCGQAVLPQIPFAPGEAAIDVMNAAAANGASKQRILNCPLNKASTMPVQYADDTERDRVEKYEAAAELNETSWLGKDCSQAGCPGIDITGQTGIVYRASYGRSQFTGATFLETINGLTSKEKQALGVTPDMQARITAALKRSNKVGSKRKKAPGEFSKYRDRYTCATAASAWDNAGRTAQPPQPAPLTIAERTSFQTNTGLGRQAFIDMVCFVPAGNARPIGEGRNAFMTEAIFTDSTLKSWMMDIFKSDDKFGYISRTLIRNNLRKVLGEATLANNFLNAETPKLPSGAVNPSYASRQHSIEEELAMRVSRLHNGGEKAALSQNVSVLTSTCINNGPAANTPLCDRGAYVKKFIGITNGHGDWRSLRCAADAKSAESNRAAKWRALELKPLSLPGK